MATFPENKVFSSAEHSDEHMKYLRLSFTICFSGVSSASTLARIVCQILISTRKLTSFTLCCYVIGLLNRPQANRLRRRPNMYILSNFVLFNFGWEKKIHDEVSMSCKQDVKWLLGNKHLVCLTGWEPCLSNQQVNPVLDGTGLQTFCGRHYLNQTLPNYTPLKWQIYRSGCRVCIPPPPPPTWSLLLCIHF